MAVEAIRTLIQAASYVGYDVAKSEHAMETIFLLLDQPPDAVTFASVSHLLALLSVNVDFVSASVRAEPPVLWRLLRALCIAGGPHMGHLWTAAEGVAAIPEGLDCLLKLGAIPHLLGIVAGVKTYEIAYQNRLSAVALLSKFLWNPINGPTASDILRRYQLFLVCTVLFI